MKVKKNSLVRLQFKLETACGDEVDYSTASDPLEFICGRGDVIPGLERELIGLEKGHRKSFRIRPEDAYGPVDESLIQVLPRAGLPSDRKLEEGQRFSYRSERGAELTYRIKELRSDTIVADFNHPLAGQELVADVEIIDVIEDGGDQRI